MKKLLIAFVLGALLSSCTVLTVVEKDMSANYALSMDGKKEKALMERIPVYTSVNEIQKDYFVKSFNQYNPLVLPVIGNRGKTLTKKLVKKAVSEAEKQNGDAVVIVSEYQFQVIKFK